MRARSVVFGVMAVAGCSGGGGAPRSELMRSPLSTLPDSGTCLQEEIATIDVLANDSWVGTATVEIVTPPAIGSASVDPGPAQLVLYTPPENFDGFVDFQYRLVSDVEGASPPQDVEVLVVDSSPEANDDVAITDEDSPVDIDVLANDGGLADDPVVVSILFIPFRGSATVNPDNTIRYEPDPNAYGEDSFVYRVMDSEGQYSSATVLVTVDAVNDVPVAVDDEAEVFEDDVVFIEAVENDSFGDGLELVLVDQPPGHGFVWDYGGGDLEYFPDPDFAGTDSFGYALFDTDLESSTATVTITVLPVNDLVMANSDQASTDEDVPVTVDVLANDYAPDVPVVVTVEWPPFLGDATVVQGRIEYTPYPDVYGYDALLYRVTDSDGDFGEALLEIFVFEQDDVPAPVDDLVTVDEDSPECVLDVLANDGGLADGLAFVDLSMSPEHGTASSDGFAISYRPEADYFGADELRYLVCDVDIQCATASVYITVSPTDDAPVARPDGVQVTVGQISRVPVLRNDRGLGDGGLVVTLESAPAQGSAEVLSNGAVEYGAPAAGFSGRVTFGYRVTDGDGDSSVGTVTVFVEPDVIANVGPQLQSVPEGGTARFDGRVRLATPPSRAAWDFDGDGTDDRVVCDDDGATPPPECRIVATSRIFDGEDVFATGALFDVALADLDLDGDLDIAGGGTGTVLLGDGAGGFAGPFGQARDRIMRIATGDVSGDGVPDLVLATLATANGMDDDGDGETDEPGEDPPSEVIVLGGDGTGAFPVELHRFVVGYGAFTDRVSTGVSVADVDGDGDDDVLLSAAGLWAGGVSLLRASPLGLTEETIDLLPFASGLLAQDVDGDGAPDLLVLDALGPYLREYRNDGSGGFSSTTLTGVPIGAPGFVHLGDLDGDGMDDVLVSSLDPTGLPLPGGTLLFARINGPGGVFTGGGRPGVGDLDGDGSADVAVVDLSGLRVYRSPLNPERSDLHDAGGSPDAIAMADLDGDGNLDVVAAGLGAIRVLRGDGSGEIGASRRVRSTGPGEAADFTGDGVSDVVVYSFPRFLLLEGDGAGGYRPPRVLSGFQQWDAGVFTSADLDGDGDRDLVTWASYGPLTLGLNDGSAQFSWQPSSLSFFYFANLKALDAADLDGDGADEIFVADEQTQSLMLLANDGSGGLSVLDTLSFQSPPSAIAFEDFTGDGVPDPAFVVEGFDPDLGPMDVLAVGDGMAPLQSAVAHPLGPAAGGFLSSIAAGDLDGDGHPDAVVTRPGSLDLLLGDGAGGLSPAVNLPAPPGVAEGVALADVDGDGRLDVVWTVAGTVRVRMGLGTGELSAESRYGIGTFATGRVTVADLDGDGRPDLTVVGGNGVFTLHNSGARWELDAGATSDPYVDSGTFAARLSISAGGEMATVVAGVEVVESAPVGGIVDPGPVVERGTASFSALVSAAAADALTACEWDFGDETPIESDAACAGLSGSGAVLSREHVFPDGDPTTYTVTLTLHDEDGLVSVSREVTVDNAPASVTTPTLSLLEGIASPVTLVIEDAPDAHWAVTWYPGGPPIVDVTGDGVVTRSFTAPEQGTFELQVVVTDQTDPAGAPSAASKVSAPISLALPVVDAVPSVGPIAADLTAPVEGQLITFSAPVSAVAADPLSSCVWDWGDGSPPEEDPACIGSPTAALASRAHAFADGDPSVHTVTLTVADEDGATSVIRPQIVGNAAPSVSLGAIDAEPSLEGSSTIASVTIGDPAGAADGPFRLTWSWGDGTVEMTVVSLPGTHQRSHTWADQGSYGFTVAVADQVDFLGTASAGTLEAQDAVVHAVANVAPALAAIPAQSAVEGQVLLVQAVATDPAGPADPLVYSLPVAPSGMQVTATTGVIAWSPFYSQAGSPANPAGHAVTLEVADGDGGVAATAFTVFVIWRDDDQDGMADTWELSHGLDATRDDSAEDADGDGVSNLDEFQADSPAGARHPGPLAAIAPANGANVTDEDPAFVLENAVDLDGGPLTYQVELSTDPELSAVLVTASAAEGVVQTVVVIDDVLTDTGTDGDDPTNGNDADLADDTTYYWRGRAVDPGGLAGPWSPVRRFFYNPVNDAPGPPVPIDPFPGEQVGSLTPALVVAATTDPDHAPAALRYRFRVYADAATTDPPLVDSGELDGGSSPVVAWTVSTALSDDTSYWWTVRVSDPGGAAVSTTAFAFRVNLGNGEPTPPSLVAPADGSDAGSSPVTLEVGDAADPDGDALQYLFELAAVPSFAGAESSGWLPPGGGGTTSWIPGTVLEENRTYYWRVRATDGFAVGEPVVASFRFNEVNDPPSAPALLYPVQGETVWDELGAVTFLNGTDPEGGALSWSVTVWEGTEPGAPGEEAFTGTGSVVSGSTTTTVPLGLGRGVYRLGVRHRDASGADGPEVSAVFRVRRTPSGGGRGCSAASGGASGGWLAALAVAALLWRRGAALRTPDGRRPAPSGASHRARQRPAIQTTIAVAMTSAAAIIAAMRR